MTAPTSPGIVLFWVAIFFSLVLSFIYFDGSLKQRDVTTETTPEPIIGSSAELAVKTLHEPEPVLRPETMARQSTSDLKPLPEDLSIEIEPAASPVKENNGQAPVPYQIEAQQLSKLIESNELLKNFAQSYEKLPLKLKQGGAVKLIRSYLYEYKGDQLRAVLTYLNYYASYVKKIYIERTTELVRRDTPGELMDDPRLHDFWESEALYSVYQYDLPPDWRARRRVVSMRENYRCQRCGAYRDLKQANVHHITPRAEGGNHSLENLAFLCISCHSFMPGEGHLNLRAYRGYWVSRAGKVHTPECRYAQKGMFSNKRLIDFAYEDRSYSYCQLCNPHDYDRLKIDQWKPDIMSELEGLLPEIEKFLFVNMNSN